MRIENGKVFISQTEIATFLRCESKHKYGYGLDLDLSAGHGSNGAMQFGTICHYAMEQAYNYRNDEKPSHTWLAVAMNALDHLQGAGVYNYKGVEQPLNRVTSDDFERARLVIQGYYDNCLVNGVYDDLDPKYEYSAEVTSATRIYSDVYLEHTFDLVKMAAGGPPTIMDHKFRGRVTADELIHLHPQNQIYAWAAWEMFGASCNMAVNTVQSKPPLFKPGRKAVADFYRRDEFFYSERQLNAFGAAIRDAAASILVRVENLRAEGNYQVRRTVISNGSDACTFCPYQLVCEQELDGVMSNHDLEFALNGEGNQESENE